MKTMHLHAPGWRALSLCLTGMTLLAMMAFGSTAVGADAPDATCPTTPYLAYVNSYRALANLPLLTEDASPRPQ